MPLLTGFLLGTVALSTGITMENSLTPLLPAKKRNFEDIAAAAASGEAGDGDNEPTEEDFALMSRSERKRHREKKRRSDVNRGFDELMALLLEVDPAVKADAEERAAKGQCKRVLGAHEDNLLSRVDLISTAIKVLKRVHYENERNKKIIEGLIANRPSVSASTSAATGSMAGVGGGVAATGNGGLSNSLSGYGSSSLMDPATLMQQQSLLAGLGAATAPAATQNTDQSAHIRAAQALLLAGGGNVSQAASQLGVSGATGSGLSAADLLVLRAAANRQSSLGVGGAESSLWLQLQNHRSILQSVMNAQANNNASNGSGSASAKGTTATEALYGALSMEGGPFQRRPRLDAEGRHSSREEEKRQAAN